MLFRNHRKKNITHTYTLLTAESKLHYVKTISDSYLIILHADLQCLKTNCPLVIGELRYRGISATALDSSRLPTDLRHGANSNRSFPPILEHLWKLHILWSCRLSIIGAPVSIALFQSSYTLLGMLLLLNSLYGVIGLILFGYFNIFYYPLQYTLIRPFNDRKYSTPLKKFIVQNIGLRCQGVGLSDKHLSPNQALAVARPTMVPAGLLAAASGGSLAGPMLVLLIVSTWVQHSVKLAILSLPSDFLLLPTAFRKQHRIAMYHLVSAGQCFHVSTSDCAWKYAIQYLIYRSNFIVVDLSYISKGTAWELDFLRSTNQLDRCIPICQEGLNNSSLNISSYFEQPIVYYTKRGVIRNRTKFTTHIQSAMQYACAD